MTPVWRLRSLGTVAMWQRGGFRTMMTMTTREMDVCSAASGTNRIEIEFVSSWPQQRLLRRRWT